jgi:hypothetical protein
LVNPTLSLVNAIIRESVQNKAKNEGDFGPTWGRCYDLRSLTIFGEKIVIFLKKQCYDPILAKLAVV